MLAVTPLFYWVLGLIHVALNTMAGAGDTLFSMVAMIAMMLLRVVLAWGFLHLIGTDETGIWWAFVLSWVLTLLLTQIYYFSGAWKKKPLATLTLCGGTDCFHIGIASCDEILLGKCAIRLKGVFTMGEKIYATEPAAAGALEEYGNHIVQYSPEYSLCTGCETCSILCGLSHEGFTGPGNSRIRIDLGTRSMIHRVLACQQCSDHPCYDACPKRERP